MLTSLRGSRKFRSKKPPRISAEMGVWLRLSGLRLVTLLLFGILAVQLWRMQVADARRYQTFAENNRIRIQAIPPPRGVIFDRNGRQLVQNVPSFAVTVVPFDLPIEEQAQVSAKLAKLLKIRPEEVEKPIAERRLRGDLYRPVLIKSSVDRDTTFLIEERSQELKGVRIRVEAVRQYLGGPLYSHLLGYLGRIDEEEYERLSEFGYDLNERIGKTGIELTYEEILRGAPGREQEIVNATGKPIGELEAIAPTPGQSLVLTVDSALQEKVADILRETMGQSKYAVGIVMDTRTGELLSFVSLPGYDNNAFSFPISDADWGKLLNNPARPLVNHAISDNFPPGSIFKLITAGAAMQEKVATVDTRIFSRGYLEISADFDPSIKFIFKDWTAHGWLDMYQAIARSGDVYFYELGGGFEGFQGLGVERLASYARAFGLGEKTGVELPGEVEGNVPTPDWKIRERKEEWFKGDTYNMSIGQGYVTVTPLQMMMVLGAFANGGELLKPQIVKSVIDGQRNVLRSTSREVRRRVPVSPEYIAEVNKGMVLGVDWEAGTARDAGVPGIKIAAKTGTAEFGYRDPVSGEYEFKHGWCYAFGPVENPEIAVLVFHERGGGGQSAAPATGKILRHIFARTAR